MAGSWACKRSADAASSEILAATAAEHCATARRSCCKFPAVCPRRAASARARDIPDSNTAPSNPADIASFSQIYFRPKRRRESRMPRRDGRIPERMRDCERGALVCQEKFILLVVVQFRNGKKSISGWVSSAGVPVYPEYPEGLASYERIFGLGRRSRADRVIKPKPFFVTHRLADHREFANRSHEEARHKARALRSERAPRRFGASATRMADQESG